MQSELKALARKLREQAACLPHYFPGRGPVTLAQLQRAHFNEIANEIDALAAALAEQVQQ
jgi:hypothetical protein